MTPVKLNVWKGMEHQEGVPVELESAKSWHQGPASATVEVGGIDPKPYCDYCGAAQKPWSWIVSSWCLKKRQKTTTASHKF